jgi:preprotein translocase subunit SecB
LYQTKQLNIKIMTTLTITVNGKKSGEKVFFILNVAKANFLNVIDMTWETVEDVLAGEAKGQYTIAK